MKPSFVLRPLLAVVCVGLFGCETEPTNHVLLSLKGPDKLIARVVEGTGAYAETTVYTYDKDDRLRSETEGDDFIHYTYPSANTMVERDDDDEATTLVMNNDGLITKIQESPRSGAETEHIVYSGLYATTHVEPRNDLTHWTWANGELISEQDSDSLTEYEYGTTPNLGAGGWFAFEDSILLAMGYYGRHSAHLPIKMTETETGRTPRVTLLRYELDPDGYVTKIYRQPQGGVEVLAYSITYK